MTWKPNLFCCPDRAALARRNALAQLSNEPLGNVGTERLQVLLTDAVDLNEPNVAATIRMELARRQQQATGGR